MTPQTFSIQYAGRPLTIGVGRLAQQAGGACTVQFGDTLVLCTATIGEAKEDAGYFPLSVEYEERMYASGKIKGSRFIKREGRPTDEAILSGRLIDRAVRPLFPSNLRNEVTVVATVFSHDQENDADIPALIGASCALAMSDIPWNGPISAIRIGRKDDALIALPTYAETELGELDLVVAGTKDKTLMIEAGAKRVSEDVLLEAMKFAHEQLGPVIDLINQVVAAVGKGKVIPKLPRTPEELAKQADDMARAEKVNSFLETQRGLLFTEPLKTKADRKAAVGRVKVALEAYLLEQGFGKDTFKSAYALLEAFVDHEVTEMILKEERRADGREINEIRTLSADVALVPRTHGSGLFQRGQTQVLSTVTLGSPGMEQTIDTMEYSTTRRYFHHYNFPSYSVGETRPSRGPGRREIGHGALAERALIPVLPPRDQFPYTIRVVSEVLGSNGSSSMGAVCGSTLSLMDAGVPLLEPVAGIAMGMASDESTGRYRVITDLQDLEDGEGGMDLKIAGTKTGITAIQMDTKTSGLPWHVVEQAVHQSREARLQVLETLLTCLPEPRAELSPFAPRIVSFKINQDRIRDVIGPGGKVINEIIATHKVQIDIEDDGTVMVTSVNLESLDKAVAWIKQLTREVQAGEKFSGPVTRILDFGAFVEILPKVEGLVHVSEMAPYRVGKVTDIVQVGQMVNVVVKEIDSMGRLNLSMKMAEGNVYPPAPSPEEQASFGRSAGGKPSSGGSRPPRKDF